MGRLGMVEKLEDEGWRVGRLDGWKIGELRTGRLGNETIVHCSLFIVNGHLEEG